MTTYLARQLRFDLRSIAQRMSSLLIVVFWSLFCVVGIIGLAAQDVRAGHLDGLSDRLVSQGYALLLAGSLIGAFLVTEEDRWHSFAQSLRIAGSRETLLASKLAGAALVGLIVGIYAVVLALVTTWLVLDARSLPFHVNGSTFEIAGGVLLVCVTATVVGLALGLIVRTTTAALIVILFGRLGIEEGLLASYPKIGKWTFAGSQASVYRDAATEHLAFLPGLALMLAWMVGLLLVGRQLFLTRDLA
ncbi:MAG: hypothetical protein QM679_04920 [Patulibacter sp.]